jgi:Holliday junction resolvase RusA-like endonuclease
VKLWIKGWPRTKGSLKPQRAPSGRVRLVDNEASRRWQRTVTMAVRSKLREEPDAAIPAGVPAQVSLTFGVPYSPLDIHSGDLDKLVRAVFDALKQGGWWADDSQCCRLTADKIGPVPPDMVGVWVVAEPMVVVHEPQ